MTARHFVYRTLTTYPALIDLIRTLPDGEPRVFAKKSMTSLVEDCPYLVYKLGYNASEDLSEERNPERQFIQIFVHDFQDAETADYEKIDEVIEELKKAFVNASSPEDGIMSVRYLETSQDLNDDTLNTVMKYVRFQLIKE